MFLHTLTKRRCALSGEVFAAAPHVVRIGLVDAPLDGEVGGELRLGEPLQAPEGQRLALLVEGGVVPVYMLPGGGEAEHYLAVVGGVAHLFHPALVPQPAHELGAGAGRFAHHAGKVCDGDAGVEGDPVDEMRLRLVQHIFTVGMGQGIVFAHQVIGGVLRSPYLLQKLLALFAHGATPFFASIIVLSFCGRCKPCSGLAQQLKFVFAETDEALRTHPAQLGGKRAAVHAKVIRQLLAVEGNGEAAAVFPQRLGGKVGQQPSADGFGRGVENTAGEREVLLRCHGQQVADERRMVGAGGGTGAQQARRIQKQHLGALGRHGVHHQRFARQTGIGFGKNLPGAHMAQNAPAAPDVHALDVDAAGEHQAQRFHGVPRMANDAVLLVNAALGAQALQHIGGFPGGAAPEQRGLREK